MVKTITELPSAYKKDIKKAVEILKNEGCEEVFLFGSLAEGRNNSNSDIDLAVTGCPPEKYFKLIGRLLGELNHSVHLIKLDDQDNRFVEHIKKEGTLIHVSWKSEQKNRVWTSGIG